jgi:exodeoxyribonuclease-3
LTAVNRRGAFAALQQRLCQRGAGKAGGKFRRMKIATFNVNGIGARLPRVLEWLAESQPDVACLQEIKTVDDGFPALELQAAGWHAIWHGQKGFNGVALLARGGPPAELQRGLPGDPSDVQSRYLEARVGGVRVASIYLPNGNPQPGPKFDYKLAWMERLIAHAAPLAASDEPVVLAGDYNVVPTDAVRDIYSPASWKQDALLQPESRDAFGRLLAQGWTDALAHRHGDRPMYTYWDYFRQRWQRNAGLRIDHLLLNAAALARLQDAGVDRDVRGRDKPSDHAPAWVTLAG